MGIDWNLEVRNRAWAKVRALDSKNNCDKLATMRDFIKWARKGGNEVGAVNYGDYTEVRVNKIVQKHGIKGRGWCVVLFNDEGDIINPEY